MLKDINLDEFNNTVLTKDKALTFIPDDEYWQSRNFVITRFAKKKEFWRRYLNSRIKDSVELEKNIEVDIEDILRVNSVNRVKPIVLITGSTAKVFFFFKSNNLYEKDKLLLDFDITI